MTNHEFLEPIWPVEGTMTSEVRDYAQMDRLLREERTLLAAWQKGWIQHGGTIKQ